MKIKDMIDCSGHVALVTGGTGYLGASMCEALLECGFFVIAAQRGKSESFIDEKRLTHDELERLTIINVDLSTKSGIHELIDHCTRVCPAGIDVLINNFCQWPKITQFFDSEFSDFEESVVPNIIGPLYLTRHIFLQMVTKCHGSIINVSSMYGHVAPNMKIYRDSGMSNAIGYGISKAAMIQMTKYLASIGGKYGIRCNSISPGPFPRPGAFEKFPVGTTGKSWFEEELDSMNPLGRVGKQHELKGAVVLLATELGSYITGADVAVDGGWRAW